MPARREMCRRAAGRWDEWSCKRVSGWVGLGLLTLFRKRLSFLFFFQNFIALVGVGVVALVHFFFFWRVVMLLLSLCKVEVLSLLRNSLKNNEGFVFNNNKSNTQLQHHFQPSPPAPLPSPINPFAGNL